MFNFSQFVTNYGPLLSSTVNKAYKTVIEDLAHNKYEPTLNFICTAIHSAFFHICKYDKAISIAGFKVIDDTDSKKTPTSNKKMLLYHPTVNCILRFGKMSQQGYIAKCTTDIDKKFASQENLDFDFSFCAPEHLHIGYVEGKDGLQLSDVFITYPINEKTNKYIWKLSEQNQPLLFNSDVLQKESLKAFLSLNNASHNQKKPL